MCVCRYTVLDTIKSIYIQYPSVATVPKKEEGYDAGPMGYGKTREKRARMQRRGNDHINNRNRNIED